MSKSKHLKIIAILSVALLLSIALMIRPSYALLSQNSTSWFWTGDTSGTSVAIGDVNGDGQNEIVSAGYFNDGTRFVAQILVWNATTLTVERGTGWYWINDTTVTCITLANITRGVGLDIVTGGSYFDGTRWVAQVIVWNGTTLAAQRLTTWYWFNNTEVSSLAVANVTGGSSLDIISGGAFFDNTRWVAQVIVWNSTTMAAQRLTSWYWTSDTFVNSVAIANVTGGRSLDIVTGGSFFDGTRSVAQLIDWNSATMAAQKVTAWYWTSTTTINSIAIANFTGGSSLDIITAGFYNDNLRNNAQIIVWNSATFAASNIGTWFSTSNTVANSVGIMNFGALGNRIIADGSFFDGTRENAQIVIWG
jgi:hypothetical protein